MTISKLSMSEENAKGSLISQSLFRSFRLFLTGREKEEPGTAGLRFQHRTAGVNKGNWD